VTQPEPQSPEIFDPSDFGPLFGTAPTAFQVLVVDLQEQPSHVLLVMAGQNGKLAYWLPQDQARRLGELLRGAADAAEKRGPKLTIPNFNLDLKNIRIDGRG